MTTTRTITPEWLKSNNATADEYDLFCAEWPEGCEATHDNLVRAAAIGLDMEWFAKCVLPPQVFADYEEKCDALYAAFRSKSDPLFADFKARRAALEADYEARRSALYADYEASFAPLLIPTLLNHCGELPASNMTGGN